LRRRQSLALRRLLDADAASVADRDADRDRDDDRDRDRDDDRDPDRDDDGHPGAVSAAFAIRTPPSATSISSTRGYRAAIQGVAMHRPNESGYSRPDAYVLDDWR
jgi:hypothetical protein